MRVPGRAGIWALGDCANIPGPDGKPYPQLAQHAMREAKVLARNLLSSIRAASDRNSPPAPPALEPFVYHSLGTLASLARFDG